MALINKKLITERETASYKLDCTTIELVRSYSEFIGSPQEHVVNEALLLLFRKDKDFNEWLKAKKNGVMPTAEFQGKGKGSAKTTAPIPAAGGNKVQ